MLVVLWCCACAQSAAESANPHATFTVATWVNTRAPLLLMHADASARNHAGACVRSRAPARVSLRPRDVPSNSSAIAHAIAHAIVARARRARRSSCAHSDRSHFVSASPSQMRVRQFAFCGAVSQSIPWASGGPG